MAVMDRRGGHVSTLVPHKIAPATAKVVSQERKMQKIQKYKNKSTKIEITEVKNSCNNIAHKLRTKRDFKINLNVFERRRARRLLKNRKASPHRMQGLAMALSTGQN